MLSYPSWARGITKALNAKGKLAFVDGSLPPPKDPAKKACWKRCDDLMVSWITNSCEPDIRSSCLYANSAFTIWKDLHVRFSQVNAPKLFQLKTAISNLKQDENKFLLEQHARHRATEFLQGLHDKFAPIRSQILFLETIPTAERMFNLVKQEEMQEIINNSIAPLVESVDLQVYGNSQHFRSSTKRQRPFCDHCHGHTKEHCYRLHGFSDHSSPHQAHNGKPHVVATTVQPVPAPPTHHVQPVTVAHTPTFTAEQYNHILALLNTPDNEDDASAREISEKAKESQKHNEHVHYLGPSGYASKRTKWSIDDPIASLNDPDCSNMSLLSTERTGRGFDWLRARVRADGQGGHYFPNKKTKDVCLTMNELHNQASEGSWTPQGHDDLLARALGNKEHGGRVRGVGGGVKIKYVFKSGPRKHSGLVSTDELATSMEEIRKKVQKECVEMMNSKFEGIFNQLKQMGVSLEADQFLNDAGARKVDNARSSCHSVDLEDFSQLSRYCQHNFVVIIVPILCRLCVIHPERGKVVAARGTLFPTNNQGEMNHNNPIAPQNVRVSVDDVITEYQLTPIPVPCYEHETIGNAAGSFVQWPKELVMLGQDPILEKKKLHEMTPIQKSSKVESKGSVTPLKQSP
ncbi:hypothetical protein AgCh_002466 [Apium graveolens]